MATNPFIHNSKLTVSANPFSTTGESEAACTTSVVDDWVSSFQN